MYVLGGVAALTKPADLVEGSFLQVLGLAEECKSTSDNKKSSSLAAAAAAYLGVPLLWNLNYMNFVFTDYICALPEKMYSVCEFLF